MHDAALTTTRLELRGIEKRFRGHAAVSVEHLALVPGRTLAVLGPSGAGKSTLLAIAGLLDRPDAGEVLLDGAAVTTRDRSARMRMAAVFQRPYLFRGTVASNVAYGLRIRRVPENEKRRRVQQALERVGLAGFEDRVTSTLSGGEAQRVALARALVLEPAVLLLDEPLASLDPIAKWRLARDFASILREAGVTTLYVTHDQDEALTVADDVAIMRDGRVVAAGAVQEVFSAPADAWVASFLSMEPALRGTVHACDEGTVQVDVDGVMIAAVGSVPPGEEVLLGIRPEDVLLFEADVDLPLGSARNRIDGTVTGIEHVGSTYRVVVQVRQVKLAARISSSALREMRLERGSRVTAVFKASAVSVVPAREVQGVSSVVRVPSAWPGAGDDESCGSGQRGGSARS